MQTEKAILLGFTITVLAVGLLIGAAFLTYTPNTPSNGNGGSTSPATISEDTDLLDLSLRVPDWNFLMSDDSILSIRDYEGQFVLIDLMATWCTACSTQNGYLEILHDNLEDSLEIISLSVDLGDTVSMMADYMENKELSWLHGLDTSSSFVSYFNVNSIPTMIIIDDSGYFRWVHTGLWSVDSMTQSLALMMP